MKGMRKKAPQMVKQLSAPASQYTVADRTGPSALARAPRLLRIPICGAFFFPFSKLAKPSWEAVVN